MPEISSAKTNAALTTGIIGTTLSGLLAAGAGVLGLGGNREESWCNEDHHINRYDMAKENEITQLKMEKAILEANSNTNIKIANTYEKINDRIEQLYKNLDGKIVSNSEKSQAMFSEQAVYNATNTAAIGCLQRQVTELQGMTKMVIPSSSICPPPMPLYNSWKEPKDN